LYNTFCCGQLVRYDPITDTFASVSFCKFIKGKHFQWCLSHIVGNCCIQWMSTTFGVVGWSAKITLESCFSDMLLICHHRSLRCRF